MPLSAVLARAERTRRPQVSPSSSSTPAAAEAAGDMLPIPRSALERMFEQLGNLHAGGQELAEARERAARAETEATFLRERIAELRERLDEKQPSTTAQEPASKPSRSPERGWWRRTFGGA